MTDHAQGHARGGVRARVLPLSHRQAPAPWKRRDPLPAVASRRVRCYGAAAAIFLKKSTKKKNEFHAIVWIVCCLVC